MANTAIKTAFTDLKTAVDAIDTTALATAAIDTVNSGVESDRQRLVRSIARLKAEVATAKADADRLPS